MLRVLVIKRLDLKIVVLFKAICQAINYICDLNLTICVYTVYSIKVYIFHITLESIGKCFCSIIVLDRIDNLNILFLNIQLTTTSVILSELQYVAVGSAVTIIQEHTVVIVSALEKISLMEYAKVSFAFST